LTGPKPLNWIELDAAALRSNLAAFRERLAPGARLGAVVKANGYGHGMLEVARLAVEEGADWLCVNGVDEAVLLRRAGHERPILILGYVALDALEAVVEHDLRPTVYSAATLERLQELAARHGRVVPVHLKVETGTHRQGVPEEEALRLADFVRSASALRLEGIGTHFANIEDTTNHGYAERQIGRFERIRGALREAGHELPVCHTACSAATVLFSRIHLDLVRVGISLYGLWPSKETYLSSLELGRPRLELAPVLSWKSRVAQVKQVPEGSYVGYGCTYRTTRDARIAVLPVGYHEGYDRGNSGVAHVLVRGKRAPVRGRVCMNMCMVDVTDIPGVEQEDEAVLLGAQGDERITAEQLAAWCGTISYEVVARIHPDLPRIVV
jgi:alanine racemase